MNTKKENFIIDLAINKYQLLSTKEKSIINLGITLFLVTSVIGSFYSGGEIIGTFLYNISH
ncbi:hypothetical protein LPB136_02435 [Tenacibaculum todarodis]|uniref:Uncharacterized protein n=1 Tax=Tenacibaculum todarodis TaxID=1850252 RepID=A0A1L3JGP4_9FLAO|nr:hypothetical protein [Tenacibaculum todarodis]APG64296.1 hypothetical protein LPB136_02435 [Tenacibaculum todarodis]